MAYGNKKKKAPNVGKRYKELAEKCGNKDKSGKKVEEGKIQREDWDLFHRERQQQNDEWGGKCQNCPYSKYSYTI